jgi:hypothetical protein
MNNASLLIFHNTWKIRQILLVIVVSQDEVVRKERAIESPEKFGFYDLEKSQKFGIIEILDSRILVGTSTRLKLLSKIFEIFIVCTILFSWIILTINTPLDDPKNSLSRTLFVFDVIFTVIFSTEAVMKIIAFGFFWNQYDGISAYARNIWDLLDFVVVVVSIVDLYYTFILDSENSQNLGSIKALRAIRALRPLRMISKSKGLKVAIQALFSSIPSMGNVLIICVLFVLIFAILGVNFFKGAYYTWELEIPELMNFVEDWRSCLDVGGNWIQIPANFDNVINAWITLFEMMTTEGWIDIMSNGIDARGIEKQPEKEHNQFAAVYFVVFIIFGWFLLINLFTAVITDNFNKIKEAEEIGAGETVNEVQKHWVQVQNMALKITPIKRPKIPNTRFRVWVFNIVMSQAFDLIIISIIILNTIVLAMTYARMSNTYELTLDVFNFIFVFLYNVEFTMKLIGLGKQYFTHDRWNLLDFICVIGSDLSVLFIIVGVGGPLHSIIIFLRAFRVIRIMRFINDYVDATTITTLINAAPQIQNVLTLIILMTFIYAALGINLFATVMYRDVYNEQNNFRDIFNAVVLLIRWLTGEDWNGIMHDLASNEMYDKKECIDNQTYDDMQKDGIRGWGSQLAYPFFISYFILNAVIILDLSIGVFITALSESRRMKNSYFNQERISEFLKLWSDYDPDSTGWIHVDQLLFLIFELPIPYGRGKCNPEYTNQYKFETIYKKRFKENYFQVKCLNSCEDAENDEDYEIIRRDVIKRIEFNQDIYLINEYKGLTIRETRAPLIMSYHKIPIYSGWIVNFKDVFQQIIKNAFDHTGEHYKPDLRVQAKFQKKWQKGIKRKDVLLEMVDEFMAGKMILNKYRLMHSRQRKKWVYSSHYL